MKFRYYTLTFCFALLPLFFFLGVFAAPASAEACEVTYPDAIWMRHEVSTYHDGDGNVFSGTPEYGGSSEGCVFAAVKGFFPEGMLYDQETGIISGTPSLSDSANTYEFKITVEVFKSKEILDTYDLEIVVRPKTPQEQLRPILLFDDEEEWRPLNINNFLTEGFTSEEVEGTFHHKICNSSKECEELTGSKAENEALFEKYLGDNAYIKIYEDSNGYHSSNEGCITELLKDCNLGSLYWHSLQPKGPGLEEPVFYDYWAFYRYNDYPILGEIFSVGEHEGDWEGVLVASNSEDYDPTGFNWVAMDSHGHTWHYLSGTLYCDGLEEESSCKDGPEGVKGQRVMAYVAEGSHATYPRPCEEICFRTDSDGELKIPWPFDTTPTEQEFGGEIPWPANDFFGSLVNLQDSSNQYWNSWDGRWGSDDPNVESPLDQYRAQVPWEMYGIEFRKNDKEEIEEIHHCTERYTDPESNDCEEANENFQTNSFNSSKEDSCSAWNGPFVQASICNPQELQRSIDSKEFADPGAVQLIAPEDLEGAAVDSSPGVTQLVSSQPLSEGSVIQFNGKLSSADQIMLKIETKSGSIREIVVQGVRAGKGKKTLKLISSKRCKVRAILTIKRRLAKKKIRLGVSSNQKVLKSRRCHSS